VPLFTPLEKDVSHTIVNHPFQTKARQIRSPAKLNFRSIYKGKNHRLASLFFLGKYSRGTPTVLAGILLPLKSYDIY
jgi:hypothetical protein